MDKSKETTKALNELLQGEYMAVESFNNFISRVDDNNIKNGLQDIQKQHRQNIDVLASYIQNIGGKPDENLGLKGKMAELKMNMDLVKSSPKDIIKEAIEGETKGIEMTEKILRGNLDDESRNITGQILENDRNSIEMLKKLL
ncbi:MAG: PA2169 family four-helix-bundle protein [Tissierellaceae bacterium]|nr:PA2169 family four-helix-bundle protein [Tissierellaceae bacterium]